MFVRSIAVIGAAATFMAAGSADADAFGRHDRQGKYVTRYEKVTTTPVYRTVTRRVMVRPASCSQYSTPPTYAVVKHEVVVQPSYQVVYSTPAVYDPVEVVQQVRPARTRWTRRHCNGTDYRCTVTTPAKYRTRRKLVMTQPGQRWVETRPAVKSVVQKHMMVRAGTLKLVCGPPVYKTVTQRVFVGPGTEHWVPVTDHQAPQTQHPASLK